MGIDNVNDVSPFVQYTAIAAQTDFTYPFPIFEDADLVVEVDGVTQALTTDYTVSGAGDDTGGTVSFVTAPGAGAIVSIYRDTPIERLSDFQTNGPFDSSLFNDVIDQIYLILQELEKKIGRAMRFPLTSSSSDAENVFDPIANWKSKYIRIDSAGEMEPADLLDSVVSFTAETIGQLLYPQSTGESNAAVTPSKFRYPVGDIRRYGAVLNGVTDDSDAFRDAMAGSDNGIFVPEGICIISSAVTKSGGYVVIRGVGEGSIIRASADSFNLIELTSPSVVDIENLRFEGAASDGTPDQWGLVVNGSPEATIRDCVFAGSGDSARLNGGIKLNLASDGGLIQNCTFDELQGTASDKGIGVLVDGSELWRITDNYFFGVAGTRGLYGVKISAGDRNLVSNNVFKGMTEAAVIATATAGLDADQNIVQGNFVSGGAQTTAQIVIEGNTDSNRIVGNTLIDSSEAGILVQGKVAGAGSTLTSRYNEVSGNTVDNSQTDGIHILGSTNAKILRNVVDNAGQTSGNGITLEGDASIAVDSTYVIGNTVVHTAGASHDYAFSNKGTPASTNVILRSNYFQDGVSGTIQRTNPFDGPNRGTGSIASGVTSDTITHELGATPDAGSISVTLKENPTNTPGAIWVDNITTTQFDVNCENDPGASNLDFEWQYNPTDIQA